MLQYIFGKNTNNIRDKGDLFTEKTFLNQLSVTAFIHKHVEHMH